MRSVWLVMIICCAACASVVETVYVDKGNPQPIVLTVNTARDTTVAEPVTASGLSLQDVKTIIEMNDEYGASRMMWLDVVLSVVLGALSIILLGVGILGVFNFFDIRKFKRELSDDVKKETENYSRLKTNMKDEIKRLRKKMDIIQIRFKNLEIEKEDISNEQKCQLEEFVRVTELLRLFGETLDDDIYEERWKAYMRLGNYTRAQMEAKERIDLYPEDEKWLERAQKASFQAENYNEALAYTESGDKKKNGSVEYWANRGAIFHALSLDIEAIESFNQALESDPENVDVLLEKGISLSKLERHEEALSTFDKAIRITPNLFEAWHNKGITLNELKRYEEALKAFDIGTQINPKDSHCWNNKGHTLYILQRYPSAMSAYEQALRLDVNNAEAWNNKGLVLSMLAGYGDAIEAYNMAINVNRNLPEAWYNKACALSALSQKDQMLANLTEAIRLNKEWKQEARKEKQFKSFWDDPDFIALTRDDGGEESKE